MKSKSYLLYLFCIISTVTLAQKSKQIATKSIQKQPQPISCDCNNAIKIAIEKSTLYGPTVAPVGYGNIQEISESVKGDKFNFEKEHNSAWYLLSMNNEGELIFEITPTDSTNDYDFLLYQYTDSNFCEQLQKKQIKVLRSNLSRNNLKVKGITGLSAETHNEFTGQGIQNNWSKSIEVKKGNKYMLVLDNVYPEGKGHSIQFNFVKKVTISGTVTNTDSLAIAKAEVLLEDNKGETIKQISTDKKGNYSFDVTLKEGINYSLTFSADSSFIETKLLNTRELYKDPKSFTDIRTQLPKLKKGEKYIVKNINFLGNRDELIKESYSSVYALMKLMKKNKKMVIRIEGHVNGGGYGDPNYQILSEQRALKVYNILISKGIEKERMQTIGFADKMMIYRFPKTDVQSEKNRRVEINVLSID